MHSGIPGYCARVGRQVVMPFGRMVLVCGILVTSVVAQESPNWMVSLGAGGGSRGIVMEGDDAGFAAVSVDVKHRFSRIEWMGLNFQSISFSSGMDNGWKPPDQLFALSPTISWVKFGTIGRVALTSGAGAYLLRRNDAPIHCRDIYPRPTGAVLCASEDAPRTVWSSHAGLIVPVSLEAAVELIHITLSVQPELAGLVPLSDRPRLAYWGQWKMNIGCVF